MRSIVRAITQPTRRMRHRRAFLFQSNSEMFNTLSEKGQGTLRFVFDLLCITKLHNWIAWICIVLFIVHNRSSDVFFYKLLLAVKNSTIDYVWSEWIASSLKTAGTDASSPGTHIVMIYSCFPSSRCFIVSCLHKQKYCIIGMGPRMFLQAPQEIIAGLILWLMETGPYHSKRKTISVGALWLRRPARPCVEFMLRTGKGISEQYLFSNRLHLLKPSIENMIEISNLTTIVYLN